jgi:hypothetical protein
MSAWIGINAVKALYLRVKINTPPQGYYLNLGGYYHGMYGSLELKNTIDHR